MVQLHAHYGLSTLATVVAEVAEIGDYSLQCGQGFRGYFYNEICAI